MSERISCPGCKRFLALPRDRMDPWLACPECATRFRNPQAGPFPGEAKAGASGRPCPSCGGAMESGWVSCPHCHEAPQGPSQLVTLEEKTAVRPDSRPLRSIGFALCVSGVPLGMALIVALVLGLVSRMDEKAQGPMLIGFGALFGLLTVCGVIAGLREARSRRPGIGKGEARRKRRVEPILTAVAGALSGVGVLVALAYGSLAWWNNDRAPLINTLTLLFALAIGSTWIVLARRVNPRGPDAGMIFVGALFLGAILLMEGHAMVGCVLVFTTAVSLLVGMALGLPADGTSDGRSPFHPFHRT